MNALFSGGRWSTYHVDQNHKCRQFFNNQCDFAKLLTLFQTFLDFRALKDRLEANKEYELTKHAPKII